MNIDSLNNRSIFNRYFIIFFLCNSQLILIGATADDPIGVSGPLVSAFQTQLGITPSSSLLNSGGLLAFVAQKGMPEKAVYVSEPSGDGPNLYLSVQVQGEEGSDQDRSQDFVSGFSRGPKRFWAC